MTAARFLAAGALYALLVFAAGFVLGVVRVLVLAPAVGETAAVAIELPVILALAWIASLWVARRLRVPAAPAPRLTMGAAALVLVLAADIALGLALLGLPVEALAARYSTAAGLAGLAGQVVFAAIPLVQSVFPTGSRPRQ